ncbi:MAG: phosphoenolpyruvate-dependent sugar phosphotransferase system 2 [Planctomycetaceae bacterium]|nr:phosphoenolpyruvate-dependent sugar phosphotransferase system 2 [Planctomycetaceae bacterium]
MDHQLLNLDQLAVRLGRDRREVERLVVRGNLPGRKVNGQWQFHSAEVTQWLEQEIRGYDESQLAQVESAQNSQELDPQFPVTSLLKPELVQVPLEARTKRSVLEALLEVAGRTWQVWEPASILQAIQQREDVYSTAFENGVAIPHTRTPMPDALGESVIAFGRTFSGIPFGAPKRVLSDLFFLVLCRDSRTHLQVLARLGRMMQQSDFVEALRTAEDAGAAYQMIIDAEQKLS